jgi:ornithine cyclodeaminase/alanine dehydrogenase-like protein (mu-crystallin family)
MLQLSNEDVVRLASMERFIDAAEESLRRVDRGQQFRGDAGFMHQITDEDNFDVPYQIRVSPLRDTVAEACLLRIGSFVPAVTETSGTKREGALSVTGSGKFTNRMEKPGVMMLFDMRTGRLLAIIAERDLAVMGIGAVGGLHAKYYAREDANSVGVIGSGWTARAHLQGACVARDIKRVRIYSPTSSTRQQFVRDMQEHLAGIEVTEASSAEEVVRGADILISGTSAQIPTFDPDWVEPGTHVHCTTGAEYGPEMLEKADIISWKWPEVADDVVKKDPNAVIGDPQQAKLEARKSGTNVGYHAAGFKVLEPFHDKRVFLIDIATGRAKGRTSDDQITFSGSPASSSLSGGYPIVAKWIYDEALNQELVQDQPDDWLISERKTDTFPMYRLRDAAPIGSAT